MSKPFRIHTLNMQFGQTWDDAYPDHAPIRLEETLKEIQLHNADIVMLQEVEHAQPGGAQPAVPPNYTWLQERLKGYHGYFAFPKSDPRELPFGIGLAIFSRTPLRDCFKVDLPSPPVEFDFFGVTKTPTDRVLIGATTTIGGRDLRLLNTHLLAFFMLKTSSELHTDQRKLVEDQLRRSSGPTILTGDFNVSKHHSLIKQFSDAGYETVQDKEITWRRRPYVLDHVFHNKHLKPVAWKVTPTIASDHHSLTADLVFAD
jgi:endonuclease/exonuclease/phosphatase family metal-dependent hydrolase